MISRSVKRRGRDSAARRMLRSVADAGRLRLRLPMAAVVVVVAELLRMPRLARRVAVAVVVDWAG